MFWEPWIELTMLRSADLALSVNPKACNSFVLCSPAPKTADQRMNLLSHHPAMAKLLWAFLGLHRPNLTARPWPFQPVRFGKSLQHERGALTRTAGSQNQTCSAWPAALRLSIFQNKVLGYLGIHFGLGAMRAPTNPRQNMPVRIRKSTGIAKQTNPLL